jgi:hypothetical protein
LSKRSDNYNTYLTSTLQPPPPPQHHPTHNPPHPNAASPTHVLHAAPLLLKTCRKTRKLLRNRHHPHNIAAIVTVMMTIVMRMRTKFYNDKWNYRMHEMLQNNT